MAFKFIGEASSNDLPRRFAFVDAAAACGCDAVKSFHIRHIRESFGGQHLSVTWELA